VIEVESFMIGSLPKKASAFALLDLVVVIGYPLVIE
jgi:hypothetical protein